MLGAKVWTTVKEFNFYIGVAARFVYFCAYYCSTAQLL
jgi:hypothetical protein